jgi:hypothetical protein
VVDIALDYTMEVYMTVPAERFIADKLYNIHFFLRKGVAVFAYDWQHAEDNPTERLRPWAAYHHVSADGTSVVTSSMQDYRQGRLFRAEYVGDERPDEITKCPDNTQVGWAAAHCLLVGITYETMHTTKVEMVDTTQPHRLLPSNLRVTTNVEPSGDYTRFKHERRGTSIRYHYWIHHKEAHTPQTMVANINYTLNPRKEDRLGDMRKRVLKRWEAMRVFAHGCENTCTNIVMM